MYVVDVALMLDRCPVGGARPKCILGASPAAEAHWATCWYQHVAQWASAAGEAPKMHFGRAPPTGQRSNIKATSTTYIKV